MIITISRQYAAGGSEVARRVAEALDYTLVDNQLIDEVATRAGMTREEVAEREERAPGFIDRLTHTLAASMPEFIAPEGGTLPDLTEERLVRITETVVAEVAARGRVVLVGRAAPAVLGRRDDAIHVRVVAPVAARIRRAMERLGVGADEARKQLVETDHNRARYHKQYYRKDWDDAANYDVVVNTDRLGIEGAVAVIVETAGRCQEAGDSSQS
jgi:cytidylate kinase